MTVLVVALHVGVCLFLIFVVLLQSGQAADLAGAFGGGGSQTALGMRGAATLLQKLTTAAAVVFMLTSIGLGLADRTESSVLEGLEQEAPATQPAPDAGEPASAQSQQEEAAADDQDAGGEEGEQGESTSEEESPEHEPAEAGGSSGVDRT